MNAIIAHAGLDDPTVTTTVGPDYSRLVVLAILVGSLLVILGTILTIKSIEKRKYIGEGPKESQ